MARSSGNSGGKSYRPAKITAMERMEMYDRLRPEARKILQDCNINVHIKDRWMFTDKIRMLVYQAENRATWTDYPGHPYPRGKKER